MTTFRRIIWKVILDSKFALKESSLIGGSNGSLDLCLNIGDVSLIDDDFDAYLDIKWLTIGCLFLTLLHLLGQHHYYLRIHSSFGY